MPHYRNGRPAEKFDLVVCSPPAPRSNRTVGIIVGITPRSTTCNAQMLTVARQYEGEGPWIPASSQYPESVTLGECDDLVANTTEMINEKLSMEDALASAPPG